MRRQQAWEAIEVEMFEVKFGGNLPLKSRTIKADSAESAKNRMEAEGREVLSVKKATRRMKWGKSLIPSGSP